ncbi:MAG: AI-2E family transporter [Nanoarchaeota archaeon]
MNLGEKDIRRLSTLILIIILCFLAFFVVRPVLIAAISGLILAYIFTPVYKKVNKTITNKSLAAAIISILILAIIFIPLWFIMPLIVEQIFELFAYYQTIDTSLLVRSILPPTSEKFLSQITLTLNNLVNTITLYVSKSMFDFILNVPSLLVHVFIIAFVFFYSLRDSDKLKEFVKSISPLSESNEKILVKQFKDMTDAIIYGQVIVGIVQGICAGIGFALFGIQNSLILTLLAILFSIIPFVGPSIIWGPVNIYLFASGKIGLGIAYLMYNVLIVSIIDNIIRSHLISKKTNISPAVVIVGMIGGVYLFNIIGLILGPLILAYLITLLESFRDKTVYSLFSNGS